MNYTKTATNMKSTKHITTNVSPSSMKNYWIFIIYLMSSTCFAQSRKEAKKNHLKSVTEIVSDFSSGKEVKHYDVQKKFDKNGNVTEEINYDKKGVIESKTLTKYNSEDDKIEELVYDPSGKLQSKTLFKYDFNGEKIEEQVFNDKNALVSKVIYVNNAQGLRLERKTLDAQGKVLQIKRYVYGN